MPANITMPPGTETGGQPFSLAAFPHVDGVLQAYDDPSIRIIVLLWGTRLGKTTTSLCIMSKQAATNPRNMMLSGPTKEASGRVVSSRLYPLLASTEGTRDQLLPESRRSKLEVKLRACRVFVGWSGSETSLADVGAALGAAIEIDKWDREASSEADSLALFLNRFKGFSAHKIILESTPTVRGRSRIEYWLQRSNRHRRYVPCPHCGEYQVLRKGDESTPGGFRWEKNAKGESDPDIAFRTAWYECEKCGGRIENHHRVIMLRKGVWCPDGCTVDRQGAIVGMAAREGSDIAGFGPLPSWYALTETWGSFARAWIRAQRRPRDLQDVVNSYMAETWEPKKSKSTPERIADRITGQTPRLTVPVGGLILTVTVDRQRADGGFCVYVVLAHGEEDRAWLVDWGMALTLEEIWNPVIRATYRHADEGQGLVPVAAMVDSGWDTKNTYDFCNTHPGMLPCKGSSTDLGGLPFKLVTLQDGSHTADGQLLMHVATDFWETDLQSRLDDKLGGEPGSLTLCREAAQDGELLEQLCNATLSEETDKRGNTKLLWTKKQEAVPNDLRDAVRYGLCLGRAWIAQNGGQLPKRTAINAKPRTIIYAGEQRPDGRGWHE